MSVPSLLEITDMRKSLGAIRPLHGARLDLRAGETYSPAGETDAGKSTLTHNIDGILKPDAGEIRIDGRPVRIDGPTATQRRGIGFVHREIARCADIDPRLPVGRAILRTARLTGQRFRAVTLALQAREILGFGGLIGAGRSAIARGLKRLERAARGASGRRGARSRRATMPTPAPAASSVCPRTARATWAFLISPSPPASRRWICGGFRSASP